MILYLRRKSARRSFVAGLILASTGIALFSTNVASRGPQGQHPAMFQSRMPMMGPGHGMGHGRNMVRHRYYMHNGVPSAYRNKFSTVKPTPEVVADGAFLFAEHCALCHGTKGLGDGEAGRDLDPQPPNLAHLIRKPMLNDVYLFWTISEGGSDFGTAMPAFKNAFAEEEIWKIVAAMRAGFLAPSTTE